MISGALATTAALAFGGPTWAARNRPAFARWVESFRARAIKRGISEADL